MKCINEKMIQKSNEQEVGAATWLCVAGCAAICLPTAGSFTFFGVTAMIW